MKSPPASGRTLRKFVRSTAGNRVSGSLFASENQASFRCLARYTWGSGMKAPAMGLPSASRTRRRTFIPRFELDVDLFETVDHAKFVNRRRIVMGGDDQLALVPAL